MTVTCQQGGIPRRVHKLILSARSPELLREMIEKANGEAEIELDLDVDEAVASAFLEYLYAQQHKRMHAHFSSCFSPPWQTDHLNA